LLLRRKTGASSELDERNWAQETVIELDESEQIELLVRKVTRPK